MTDFAMAYAPTWRQRFWRRMGFRYHLGEDPNDDAPDAGWMRTDCRLHFSVADRFRLLLTGKLFIAVIVHTDTPSPDKTATRLDWLIIEPGGKP